MSEDIFDRISEINNKADFLTFLSMLKNDFSLHKSEWENTTIEEYFQAVQSWIEDYSSSSFNDIEWNKLDYRTFARILYMGKIYE